MGIALVLADRDGLPPSARQSFAEAGISHLLAISGLHVGIIAVVATWLASLAFPTRRFVIGAGIVVAYVALIGAPPAALRAALLFAGYGLARSRGAPAALGDLLGAAAIVTLLIDPMDLLNPGFQLSFAGFTGLAIGAAAGRAGLRRLAARRRTRRSLRSAVLAVAASTGAFSLTAPIVAAHFERVAPIAILGSLVGAPLVALALCGLLGAVVLPGFAGELAGAGATVALRSLSGLAAVAGEIPLGHANVAPPGPLTWLLAAGLGLAVLAGIAVGSRTPVLTGLTAAAGVWALAPGLRRLETRDETLLCTLDVGQGDAAVVRTRRGAWLVLDAGPSGRRGSSRGVVRFLRSKGVRRIEALVLTHPHADHIGGAAELLDAFRVERVLDGGNPVPEPAYARLLDQFVDRGVEWSLARSGALLRLDEVSVRILGPAAVSVSAERPAVGANEGSVAFRLTAGRGFAYVSTGDAYVAQERALLERWPADSVRADVLKLGHHGSRTSTSLAWLRTVRPSIVAISVGAGNRYGHPHPETLAVLDSAPATTRWRTDRDGTLCVGVDGRGGWRIRPP